MEQIKIKIKNKTRWNTINKRNAEKILKNSVVKCNGLYTDDYARDAEENYKRDLSSQECKDKIRRDLKDKDLIKIYWENDKGTFLFFYGHWLSYTAKPKESLKIIKEEPSQDLKYHDKVEELKKAMQERTDLYFKSNFKNLEPEKVTIKKRSKYWALDVGSSGKFLIDKITLSVYTIKGYGVKGYLQGTINDVIERVQADINTFKGLMSGQIKGQYALYY